MGQAFFGRRPFLYPRFCLQLFQHVFFSCGQRVGITAFVSICCERLNRDGSGVGAGLGGLVVCKTLYSSELLGWGWDHESYHLYLRYTVLFEVTSVRSEGGAMWEGRLNAFS